MQVTFKKDLYDQYKRFLAPTPEKVLTRERFLYIWTRLFPVLQLYEQCNICGKCAVCAAIDALRKLMAGNPTMDEALTVCFILHRCFFMGERLMLAERNLHALREPKVLSVVIDIMESYELKVPHSANKNKAAKHVNSTFVGALVHGEGMNLYRTTNTVKKGANLIIHVLLSEILGYLRRNDGKSPELLYAQVCTVIMSAKILKLISCACCACSWMGVRRTQISGSCSCLNC